MGERPDWTLRFHVVPRKESLAKLQDGKDVKNEEFQRSSINPNSGIFHPRIRHQLSAMKINSFFPVQQATIPLLLEKLEDPCSPSSVDVCISAPTGQGKTLCYVIPIVQSLLHRVVPQIRAIIITPTRELAAQLLGLVSQFCSIPESYDGPLPKVPLRAVCFHGHKNFATEVRQLYSAQLSTQDNRSEEIEGCQTSLFASNDKTNRGLSLRVQNFSLPDILIATPGRLVEHFDHFRCPAERGNEERLKADFFHRKDPSNFPRWDCVNWIVLDEADRLLSQSFRHSWVHVIQQITEKCETRGGQRQPIIESRINGFGIALPNALIEPKRFRRILLSATMTKNPQKLAEIGIHNPMYFIADASGQSTTPDELAHKILFCHKQTKHLSLIYLLYQLSLWPQHNTTTDNTSTDGELEKDMSNTTRPKCVIFCASKLAAHRLARILQLHFLPDPLALNDQVFPEFVASPDDCSVCPEVPPSDFEMSEECNAAETDFVPSEQLRCTGGKAVNLSVAEFSGSLTQSERENLFRKFCGNSIDILVSSDILSRGIDVLDIDVVVNYDVPKFLNQYVHRSGRTARAGRKGVSYTFLLQKDVDNFWSMCDGSGLRNSIKEHRLPPEAVERLSEGCKHLLRKLRKCLRLETTGKLSARRELPRWIRSATDFNPQQNPETSCGDKSVRDAEAHSQEAPRS